MIPLRPVAAALGAEVTFDAKRRVTDLDFASLRVPMYHELSERRTMLPQLRGYAPPEMREYDPAVTAGTAQPWLCVGDLDGNGVPDAAFLLRRGDELRVVALVRTENSWKLLWLAYWEHVPARPESLHTVLRLRKPGEVETWIPEGPGQPAGRLTLAYDGIELATAEKPTVLYWWDTEMKSFRQLTTVPGVQETDP